MSWEHIDTTRPKSRRVRRCIWCPEKIEAQTVYVKVVGKFEGDFGSDSYHPECYQASTEFFKTEDGQCGYEPHSFKRGTQEPA